MPSLSGSLVAGQYAPAAAPEALSLCLDLSPATAIAVGKMASKKKSAAATTENVTLGPTVREGEHVFGVRMMHGKREPSSGCLGSQPSCGSTASMLGS